MCLSTACYVVYQAQAGRLGSRGMSWLGVAALYKRLVALAKRLAAQAHLVSAPPHISPPGLKRVHTFQVYSSTRAVLALIHLRNSYGQPLRQRIPVPRACPRLHNNSLNIIAPQFQIKEVQNQRPREDPRRQWRL